jgi:formate hydrogenlyase subunit 4
MSAVWQWILFTVALMVVPPSTIGLIRKSKALLQNRTGPSILQPFFNLAKLLQKSEVISEDASWLFRFAPAFNLCALFALALMVPWTSFTPSWSAGQDFFLVIYLLAAIRFTTILAAMDAGSPFGAFSSSREATLSMLVEPAVILSLVALGIAAGSSNLAQIFSYGGGYRLLDVPLWLMSGLGLFMASQVELSRMPVDDPTTHLELTMVHEAMVIENSGSNLALVELGYALRMTILYGMAGQCFIHALCCFITLNAATLALLSITVIFCLAFSTAVAETLMVKLRWTRVPEFIAYVLTMSLLASLSAIIKAVGL